MDSTGLQVIVIATRRFRESGISWPSCKARHACTRSAPAGGDQPARGDSPPVTLGVARARVRRHPARRAVNRRWIAPVELICGRRWADCSSPSTTSAASGRGHPVGRALVIASAGCRSRSPKHLEGLSSMGSSLRSALATGESSRTSRRYAKRRFRLAAAPSRRLRLVQNATREPRDARPVGRALV